MSSFASALDINAPDPAAERTKQTSDLLQKPKVVQALSRARGITEAEFRELPFDQQKKALAQWINLNSAPLQPAPLQQPYRLNVYNRPINFYLLSSSWVLIWGNIGCKYISGWCLCSGGGFLLRGCVEKAKRGCLINTTFFIGWFGPQSLYLRLNGCFRVVLGVVRQWVVHVARLLLLERVCSDSPGTGS